MRILVLLFVFFLRFHLIMYMKRIERLVKENVCTELFFYLNEKMKYKEDKYQVEEE